LFKDLKGVQLLKTCDHKDIKKYLEEVEEQSLGTPNESKEFALVGRSNVGKSSLINTILSGKPKAPLSMSAAEKKAKG
jgi:GTP-binding protein EngB required for normal cell division